MFLQRGVSYSSIDMTNMENLKRQIDSVEGDNVLVWMESPSNPLCKVTDIQSVCSVVAGYSERLNIATIVDSTWAPPTLTQPLLVRLLYVQSFCHAILPIFTYHCPLNSWGLMPLCILVLNILEGTLTFYSVQ